MSVFGVGPVQVPAGVVYGGDAEFAATKDAVCGEGSRIPYFVVEWEEVEGGGSWSQFTELIRIADAEARAKSCTHRVTPSCITRRLQIV
jgi:hypothetical protein